MSTARMIVGDVFDVLETLPDKSVNCVISSPPYHLQRRYITDPTDPNYSLELGQEPNPAAFIGNALRYIDQVHRVLRDDGVVFLNYGDKASGSGGAGGDYDDGGQREGQGRFGRAKSNDGWPMRKSIAWEPELIGASMAYGRNLLDPDQSCKQWVTRPHITWCKPAPTPGACVDKFREATELVIFAAKQPIYWSDLDAIRSAPENNRTIWNQNGPKAKRAREVGKDVSGHERYTHRTTNPAGAPPLNWMKVNTSGYEQAHFATFPPELIVPFVKFGCPEGGVILDMFGGSGTTGAVATGHGRDAILIDLDERNVDLARDRVGPMFFTSEVL